MATKTMMTTDGKRVYEVEAYALECVYTVIHNCSGAWYFWGASDDSEEAMRVARSCHNPTEIVETATMTEIPPVPPKGGAKPENIMIIDTEYRSYIAYDIGVVVADVKTGRILKSIGMIISDSMAIDSDQFLSDTIQMGNREIPLYYKANRPTYDFDSRYIKVSALYAMDIIKNLMEIYKIDAPIAYNASADINSIIKTCKLFRVESPLKKTIVDVQHKRINDHITKEYDVKDIYFITKDILMVDNNYTEWAHKYRKYANSEKMTISYSAESVISWLTNNPNYKESHNGLFDCLDELKIAIWLINQGIELKKQRVTKTERRMEA